jgi:hypothetical protein
MKQQDLIDLDKYLLDQVGQKEFHVSSGIEGEEYKYEYNMHHLVHAILIANDFDPKKIYKNMELESKKLTDDKSAMATAYKELFEVLFCPLDDAPLYVNTFFNRVVQWRLKKAL